MKKINSFVIKRSGWLRGEGNTESALRRVEDGKRCCLGIYAGFCGMRTSKLNSVLSLNGIKSRKKTLLELFEGLVEDDGDGILSNSKFGFNLMKLNDGLIGDEICLTGKKQDRYLTPFVLKSEVQREKLLKKEFAKIGIGVTFED